jgi:choline dehydrogenase-like flavoprotein
VLIEAVESGAILDTDLCVVGGGAVGLSMAHLLAGAGVEVTVLEGGGRAYDEASQSLYVGVASGTILPSKSAYLTTSRLRYLGGSTNHWQGWCRPLDPLDFEPRSWVRDSGWPISAETLRPFDDRAAELAEVQPFAVKRQESAQSRRRAVFPAGSGLESSLFHVSRPTKFGERYGPDLEASQQCRLHLNDNVVEIVTDESGRRVEHVEVVGGDGQNYKVRARAFVLAGGAVENARLLLASDRYESGGVGNRNDLVGRYFMDHPYLNGALVVLPRRRRSMRVYMAARAWRPGHRVRAIVRPTDAFQGSEELLNSVIVLQLIEPEETSELARAVKAIADDVAGLAANRRGSGNPPAYYGFAQISTEQTPDAESRVTLSDEKDALGVRRVHLDWRLSEQDAENVRRTMSVLAHRLGSTFRGRAQLLVDADQPWPNAVGSNHHLGTTRMHEDPKRGVVDADCKVHGVSNLYVGGSSVFTTGGASNPTFSLLSLAVRLADHLKGVLAT